jgi:hypothetical protein
VTRTGELGVLVVAWLAATAGIRWLRELPWSLAAIAGLAAAVLVVASLRTGRRLRALRGSRWYVDRD